MYLPLDLNTPDRFGVFLLNETLKSTGISLAPGGL